MANDMTTLQKYMFILEEINRRQDKSLTAYDEILTDRLKLSIKQLGRLLDRIENEFDNIVLVEGKKRRTYKLIKPLDLFIETFKNSQEIGWIFKMAHDIDPQVFKELEQFTNTQKNIYKFQNTPFEDVSTLESKQAFKRLRVAVGLNEYRDIKFYHDDRVHKNLKCLKLVFMDSNWYIAYVDSEDVLKFGRISFIEEVNYSKGKDSFQKHSVEKQMKFLENEIQNSMTLFGVEKKTATIKAHSPIAKYFEKDMKKFLNTQKFIEKQSDGSIIFTLDYTQELEILPFIQKWLPDLEILKPLSLKEAYRKKLQKAISLHN